MNFRERIQKHGLRPINGDSGVYRIGRTMDCVKLRTSFNENDEFYNRQDLEHEFNFTKGLYEGGVCVPRHRDLIEEREKGRTLHGFVMEYIPGQTLIHLWRQPGSEPILAMREAELAKAESLGYDPRDANYGNSIWHPKKKKVYLIDFSLWRRK